MRTRGQKFGVSALLISVSIGIIFIGIGVVSYRALAVDSSWKHVQGKIISVTTVNSGTNGIMYSPVIEYTANDQTLQVTSSTSSSSSPMIGSTKEIAYSINQPSRAKVVVSKETQRLMLIFPIIGILLIVVGPIAFFKWK